MKFLFSILFGLFLIVGLSACGVKGDPQPPETPLEMGHGKPLYQSDDDPLQPTPPKQYYKNGEQKDDRDDDQ